MNKLTKLFSLALTAATLLSSIPANARDNNWSSNQDNNNWNHNSDRENGRNDRRFDNDRDRDYGHNNNYYYIEDYRGRGFRPSDREIVRTYYPARPVVYQRRYIVGQPLARNVRWTYLPAPLLRRLPPPPRNANYILVDNDVLLISAINMLVLDAIF